MSSLIYGPEAKLSYQLTLNFLVSNVSSSPHSFWLSSIRVPLERFFKGLYKDKKRDAGIKATVRKAKELAMTSVTKITQRN